MESGDDSDTGLGGELPPVTDADIRAARIGSRKEAKTPEPADDRRGKDVPPDRA